MRQHRFELIERVDLDFERHEIYHDAAACGDRRGRFQAGRSPTHAYRTAPLRGLWTHQKGGRLGLTEHQRNATWSNICSGSSRAGPHGESRRAVTRPEPWARTVHVNVRRTCRSGLCGAVRRTGRRTDSRAASPRHRTDRLPQAVRRTPHRTSCLEDSRAGTGDTACGVSQRAGPGTDPDTVDPRGSKRK